MSQEILYTSAAQGLKPGSRGFCTVVSTAGMASNLAERLESLSGYRHHYAAHEVNAGDNPINYCHALLTVGGKKYHVLSMVRDAGMDYTQRSNKLAHHVALEEHECVPGGPAWVLADEKFCIKEWDGQTKILNEGRKPRQGDRPTAERLAWKKLTKDAGWAGKLAETALEKGGRPVSVIYAPGTDVLALVVEALSLLPPARRWDVTFSTYFTKLPPGVECQWRFLLDGTQEAEALRRNPHATVIDLCRSLRPLEEGELVNAARNDHKLPQQRPAENAAPESAVTAQGDRKPAASVETHAIAGRAPLDQGHAQKGHDPHEPPTHPASGGVRPMHFPEQSRKTSMRLIVSGAVGALVLVALTVWLTMKLTRNAPAPSTTAVANVDPVKSSGQPELPRHEIPASPESPALASASAGGKNAVQNPSGDEPAPSDTKLAMAASQPGAAKPEVPAAVEKVEDPAKSDPVSEPPVRQAGQPYIAAAPAMKFYFRPETVAANAASNVLLSGDQVLILPMFKAIIDLGNNGSGNKLELVAVGGPAGTLIRLENDGKDEFDPIVTLTYGRIRVASQGMNQMRLRPGDGRGTEHTLLLGRSPTNAPLGTANVPSRAAIEVLIKNGPSLAAIDAISGRVNRDGDDIQIATTPPEWTLHLDDSQSEEKTAWLAAQFADTLGLAALALNTDPFKSKLVGQLNIAIRNPAIDLSKKTTIALCSCCLGDIEQVVGLLCNTGGTEQQNLDWTSLIDGLHAAMLSNPAIEDKLKSTESASMIGKGMDKNDFEKLPQLIRGYTLGELESDHAESRYLFGGLIKDTFLIRALSIWNLTRLAGTSHGSKPFRKPGSIPKKWTDWAAAKGLKT